MKRSMLIVILALVSVAFSEDKKTFTGEISDSQCATNVHSRTRSHAEMTTHGTMGKNAAECVRKCVENGGQFVLVTPYEVYKLSDQNAPAEFAAQKVKIAGTLDPKTKTIKVETITAAQ
jgi:hypothetical protein